MKTYIEFVNELRLASKVDRMDLSKAILKAERFLNPTRAISKARKIKGKAFNGDDGRIWVQSGRYAELLDKAGYQSIGF